MDRAEEAVPSVSVERVGLVFFGEQDEGSFSQDMVLWHKSEKT